MIDGPHTRRLSFAIVLLMAATACDDGASTPEDGNGDGGVPADASRSIGDDTPEGHDGGATGDDAGRWQDPGTGGAGGAGGSGGMGDGPAAGGAGGAGDDGFGPQEGRGSIVRGTVWAPGNAPGQVPQGEEIPVSGALVWLTDARPEPIPATIYCETCVEVDAFATTSDSRGRFFFERQPPGRYYLVVQKGQFRRTSELVVEPGTDLELVPGFTTLPSFHNPEAGDWMPSVAVATGQFDSIEDVLGKMGLGGVDESGRFIRASGAGRFELWDNGGPGFEDVVQGTLPELLADFDRMRRYHILFIPCSGIFSYDDAIEDAVVLDNLRRYVTFGGKLYVTDWSGEFHDAVFPAQIELTEDEDTPAEAYDAETGTWNTALFGDANGEAYDSRNAEVVDPEMRDWLGAQAGPRLRGGPGQYDASRFSIQGAWNTIVAVHDVLLGRDRDGEEIIDRPKVWVIGGSEDDPEPKRPMTVTYEPAGCGRVLYSVYHTADETHVGLLPQERILLYLIMEIGICRDPKTILP